MGTERLHSELFADTWGADRTSRPNGGGDSMSPVSSDATRDHGPAAPNNTADNHVPHEGGGPIIYGPDERTIMRPITFVPGILGSEIRQRGSASRILWPPIDVGGAGSHEMFRTIKQVVRTAHADKQAIGPFPGAYDNIIVYLKSLRGERNFHPFWYDWTQSNRISGAEFAAHMTKILSWPEYADKGIDSLDVVCHSMGGLVLWEAFRINPKQIRRMVFLASPLFGAPKALFVLNPRSDLPLFSSFIQKIAAKVVWNYLIKGSDDEDSIENQIKWMATRLPSVYELLPDRHYLANHVVVTQVNVGARFRISGLDATYYDSRWGFPSSPPGPATGAPDQSALVKDAIAFKDRLGTIIPGNQDTRLIMYSNDWPTYDIIDYDDYLFDYDFDPPEASSQRNGDETVPEWSASGAHEDGALRVRGDHSGLPEHGPNHPPIGRFLQRPPI